MEVRKLIEDPGTIQDLCRVNLVAMPVISQIAQILCALQHLAAEVRTLVHTNPEHTGNLRDEDSCSCSGERLLVTGHAN